MLIGKAVILPIAAVALATSVAAQPTPPPAAITRTVIATTQLPTVTEAPLYFRAASVTLPSGEKSSVSAANGILYQMSGSTEVAVDDQGKGTKIWRWGVHPRREKGDADGRQRSSLDLPALHSCVSY
jgi:hypothetical protein